MGLGDLIRGLFGHPAGPSGAIPDRGAGVAVLAQRLGMSVEALQATPVAYRSFSIPKRSHGTRQISAPEHALKVLQRRILRRLLARLRAHPAATGFERFHSIATNALCHTGQAVVLHMDIRDFFPSTREARVRKYFSEIGWDRGASGLLTRLCTYQGGLPQGAPTSPRLSNLLNYRMDARLEGLARSLDARYTRYADDLVLSFPKDDRAAIHLAIQSAKRILEDEDYELHQKRKLQILRRYERQQVTGLVVNDGVRLPRATRRWLRAVEHRLRTGRPATLSPEALAGWRSLQSMIERQVDAARGGGEAPS